MSQAIAVAEVPKGATPWADLLISAAITGAAASVASSAVLALLAIGEGKAPLQPVNATSHWLNGPEAGHERSADAMHTGIGYATHHVSAVFWALPLEAWLANRPHSRPLEVLRDAGIVAAVAAAFDYGIVHPRLTPGWEHALSTRAIAGGFIGLGLGLAGGALISRTLRKRGFRQRS